jgi:hypothetical protein
MYSWIDPSYAVTAMLHILTLTIFGFIKDVLLMNALT